MDAEIQHVSVQDILERLNVGREHAKPDVMLALVITPSFSTRVFIDSANMEDIEALRHAPQGDSGFFFGPRRAMTTTASFSLMGVPEFTEVRRHVVEHPMSAEGQGYQLDRPEDYVWSGQAYPPMLQRPAIAAFGKVTDLHLHSANGKIASGYTQLTFLRPT